MSAFSAKARRITAVVIFLAFFALFSGDLVRLQIVKGEEYKALSSSVSDRRASIPAARGEIVGRNGEQLVKNDQGYALIFDGAYFPSADEQERRNEIIKSLIELLEASGEIWNDTLPLEFDKDGNVVFSADRENDVKKIKSSYMLDLNEYATAQNCFDALTSRYSLTSYDAVTARKIGSVCLAMKEVGFSISTPYTFASDVSETTVARIKEKSLFYSGVDVQVIPHREYVDGTVAPHIIGRVAAIDADEYKAKKDEGYAITDQIGKNGIEYAMETYLRGKPGEKSYILDADGNVTSTGIAVEPEQGNTVVLTIDPGMQKVVQDALRDTLEDYVIKNKTFVPAAGACVVLNCRTGEVLASATYPTYDVSTYSENYKELAEATADPLWNRALKSVYAPGSTMKPSVAAAALEEGLINENTKIHCSGIYTYLNQRFKCEQAHDSREVNVVAALRESCNTFFYEVGKTLGITKMNEYRTLFGFGQKTGCELSEEAGVLDSPEYRESLNQRWLPGFTVQSAIGQAGNLVSPIQLANYCATIANGGTRYRTHFVRRVISADGSKTVLYNSPEVMSETGISKKTLDIVREGMHQVCTRGYSSRYFAALGKKVDPAAKTGTSQEYRNINGVSTKINNGFFITFAPYENPEIAIAIVGEGMTSGVYTAPVAVAVYKYYFSNGDITGTEQSENTLLG